MEERCAIVFTTIDSEDRAQALARSIVEAKLAACVQIEVIRSIYRWQGSIHDEPEWRLTIKTTRGRYTALEQHIRAHHTYETPEIVCLPIAGGSSDYLAWIEASVR